MNIMRQSVIFPALSSLLLVGCVAKNTNPIDPYESYNRKVHRFNMAFDATFLKPPARVYKAVIPGPVRSSINNFFNNIAMIPSVANDLLQFDWHFALSDSWRFLVNSTFGIGGFFDVADPYFSLPPHYNDLGLTLAKWGYKQSAYFVIPLIGPSTIRDGVGLFFDYTVLSPYAYISQGEIIWGLAGLRYVDLRAQLFESEAILNEALDQYAFIRDAYLQHRHFLMSGEQEETGSLYVGEDNFSDYVSEESSTS